MLRFVFSFVVTIVTARWLYSEIQLFIPQVVPAVDYALEHVQIPTHDKWDFEGMKTFINTHTSKMVTQVSAQQSYTKARSNDYGNF